MVVALSGWVDAGLAGAGSVAVLQRAARRRRSTFGRIDLADLMDLQQTRPTVHLVDGVSREIDVAEIDAQSRAASGATSCCAPGPSRRCGGGRCSASSSTSPCSSASPRRSRVGGHPERGVAPSSGAACSPPAPTKRWSPRSAAWRQDYTGPTGAQSVLQVMLGDAGIPTLALWAQVPHYVAGGRVAAGDPRGARTAARPRRRRRSTSTALDDQAQRLRAPGRRRARPTVPTCVEVIDAIEADRRGRRRCRAATSSRRRSSGSSATSPVEIERCRRRGAAGPGRVGPAGPPESSEHRAAMEAQRSRTNDAGEHERRQDQRHHGAEGAGRGAGGALRGACRRGVESPGFEAFELLQPTDDRDTFLVYTRWASEDDFQNWVNSPAFEHGHQAHSDAGPGEHAQRPVAVRRRAARGSAAPS